MSIADLTSTGGASMGASQMDSISGASSYVPPTSTSTASTDSVLAQMRNDLKQNSQDFAALKSSLNSNNLAGATQAFATLQQDIQNASSSAGGKSPFDPSSPIGKDFQAIGQALQSGDLAGAKQAFTSFKADIKSAGRAARAQNFQATSGANDGDADDGGQIAVVTSPTTVGSILNVTA